MIFINRANLLHQYYCLIKNNRGKLHFPSRNGSNYSSGIGTSGITVSSLLTPVEPPTNIA